MPIATRNPRQNVRKKRHTQLLSPCLNDGMLWTWLHAFAGVQVPRRPVCPGHHAPFDYLRQAYFEPSRDLVVWAPRGGGKTRFAAAATLLDLLHKPGCSVRILGGSLEQSLRMWEHLLPDVMELCGNDLLDRVGARRIALENGSSAAVLTQSQRAVRGLRVQKLRCDEVELFDPEIWDAAQLVTRSGSPPTAGGGISLGQTRGTVEALSTLHTPFGLMHRIVEKAEDAGVPVIRWCLMEVLERCPEERECASCPLWDDCRGVAKTECEGFMRIDDAIAMKRRVSLEIWQAEMLCQRPSQRDAVFPHFDPAVHVRQDPDVPDDAIFTLAIDFGFKNPFVCLWVATDGERTVVLDEYVQPQQTMDVHLKQIAQRRWKARRVACDPAGGARNEQTAQSNVRLLRDAGYTVHTSASHISEGLEMIRAALRPAAGPPRLFIDPRCVRLIKALQSYRYADGGSEVPLKDGEHDHLIDALRYHFVNQPGRYVMTSRRY